jgi:cytochrome c-type biogenesis protein
MTTRRTSTFIQGAWFVAGFATFIIGVMGLATTALGDLFFEARDAVRYIGGVMMIAFGLFTLGILKLPILYRDTRSFASAQRAVGGVQSYLTGLSFAAGWSPCIGPFLGAILSMGATQDLPARVGLLTAYTLGLGLPFLLVAAMADRVQPMLTKLKRQMRKIEIVSGLLLIAVGISLLLEQITRLSASLQALGTGLEGLLPETLPLSIPVALLAGLLSFSSPCVLPLVPAYLGYIGGWAVNNAAENPATPAAQEAA